VLLVAMPHPPQLLLRLLLVVIQDIAPRALRLVQTAANTLEEPVLLIRLLLSAQQLQDAFGTVLFVSVPTPAALLAQMRNVPHAKSDKSLILTKSPPTLAS